MVYMYICGVYDIINMYSQRIPWYTSNHLILPILRRWTINQNANVSKIIILSTRRFSETKILDLWYVLMFNFQFCCWLLRYVWPSHCSPTITLHQTKIVSLTQGLGQTVGFVNNLWATTFDRDFFYNTQNTPKRTHFKSIHPLFDSAVLRSIKSVLLLQILQKAQVVMLLWV